MPSWVAALGEVDGENSRKYVFGFPDNFRYPQAIRGSSYHSLLGVCAHGRWENFISLREKHSKAAFDTMYIRGEPDERVIKNITSDLMHPIQATILD